VSPSTIHHIGNKDNKRDERETGLLHDRAEILTEHRDPSHEPFDLLITEVLCELPVRKAAARGGGISDFPHVLTIVISARVRRVAQLHGASPRTGIGRHNSPRDSSLAPEYTTCRRQLRVSSPLLVG
jgi:hypothetical protein